MLFQILWLFLLACSAASSSEEPGFIFNGFRSAGVNLSRDGIAEITQSGLLCLTNDTKQHKGHAFYNHPLKFKDPSKNNGSMNSFSTTFVFAIVPEYREVSGHGIVFVIAPTTSFLRALPSQYLGLFNKTTNGDPSNHVVGVELDTIYSSEFNDPSDNHVGIDINNLTSVKTATAGYHIDSPDHNGGFQNLSLFSGKPMQVWIEYEGSEKKLTVTLAPTFVPKPHIPLLSFSHDLSPYILDTMFVGFSSSTGSVLTSHYILGWSFKMNGQAEALDLSALPKVPQRGPKKKSQISTIGLPIFVGVFVLAACYGLCYYLKRKRMFAEVMEDWELNYRSNRFCYRDLYVATKGFREKELLGIGGFGRVYKGVLPNSKIEVAVKRISHESRQGMKEFVAEIVSMGQLRHRNLVQLLGYCRRKGELLLVYDYMPNGSLDKFLFRRADSVPTLNWGQRFLIIKGVASGLFYLHEEWEQVVIHRDVKASNVLLDAEMNGRLGDFGLARLYDHGTDPQTTHVVGTIGYLAPELTRTSKASKCTDVFAFGAFMLEVACGRRPIEPHINGSEEDLVLVDWVFSFWSKGLILEASDPKLRGDYIEKEMELVLKLGLLCSHAVPSARPSMRQVLQFLEGDMDLPPLSSDDLSVSGISVGHGDYAFSYTSSSANVYSRSSVTESILSTGR